MTKPNNVPFTREEIDRFADYHGKNLCWGSLHIVLEDGNIQDRNVDFCIDYANRHGDQEGFELGKILLTKSKSQRIKIGADMYR